jgi:hypothetical protein
MTEKNPPSSGPNSEPGGDGKAPSVPARPDRPVSPAAQRALAEAQARCAEIDRVARERPKELHGRNGPDPVRYGDWEVKGIASDF